MSTAAVVVRWRGGEEVARCLTSLLEHGGADLDQVVLVDSGSGDGGAGELARRFPAVRVLALDDNRGFAAAAAAGAAATRSARLLLLNPDAELLPGALAELAAALGDTGAAGTVPLLLAAGDDAPQHRWQLRRLPTAARLASGRAGAPAFAAPPRALAPVAQPAAACWLLAREVWDALGGLDDAFAPAWWEDVDFCARLRRALAAGELPGRQGFLVVPSARVRHAGGSTVPALGTAAFLEIFNRNLLRYARRHHPRSYPAIAVGLRLALLARAALRPRRAGALLTVARRLGRPPTPPAR